MSANKSSNSFFDFNKRPENLTGLIFGIPILGGVLFGAYKLMPFIVSLLKSTLTAGLLGLACFVLFMIFTNKRFWKTMKFMYKAVMRKITNFFIDLDPVNILRTYVHELKSKKARMEKQIGILRGHIQRVKNDVAEHMKQRVNALGLATEARARGKKQLASINAKQVTRLDKRLQMQDFVLEMVERLNATIILVTHDASEATYLSDKVFIMSTAPAKFVECVNIDFDERTKAIKRTSTFTDIVHHIEDKIENG